MSWSCRTKPRSLIKTVQWFPFFASLKGQNWNDKIDKVSRFDNKPIHPIRREYIYHAHNDEDDFLSSISFSEYCNGQKDKKETESNGRNDKTTFEFFGFGYVNTSGVICISEVGNKIVNGTFDNEDYLKQLMKLRLPNSITKVPKDDGSGVGIYPFEIVLRCFEEFDSLNRSELALLFGCIRRNEINNAISSIKEFKKQYQLIDNKNDTKKIKKIFKSIYQQFYREKMNAIGTYYDYAEALSRTLIYTGLFSVSGRSIATKLRVSDHSRTKVKMLQEKYSFGELINFNNVDDYMEWFGSSKNVVLPWDNIEERKKIISEKAELLLEKRKATDKMFDDKADLSEMQIEAILKETINCKDVNDLKVYEHALSNAIVQHNEEFFVKISSKTKPERDKIIEKYNDILDNDDMSALWLEVNTWKSLVAINGEQRVKRNFNIEDDLTPRSFAPGVGNTPDMELYKNGYIIVPEVSLMTGVQQWEHEASSVVSHVLGFIEEFSEKEVLGLFISSKINVRTMWQFYILNRESWVGNPVPVIPFTVKQYMNIIEYIYKYDLTIDDFKCLLDILNKSTYEHSNYREWEHGIETIIESWKRTSVA